MKIFLKLLAIAALAFAVVSGMAVEKPAGCYGSGGYPYPPPYPQPYPTYPIPIAPAPAPAPAASSTNSTAG